ncbi:signal peptide peptidase SppA [Agilicoccus flavus]|uniref:signal peptide peptidase SppA n=1 Tax=Agilicoccus flavus TaxID=2775968 RepID=UPI001CF69ABE|nr:signal peptide peptidase SppA [Agilicoccus flavus]
MNLRDLLDRLPIDPALLRKVPVPGLQGRVLLELDLDRGAAEADPESPIAAIRQRNTPTLRALVDGLERGARDDRVVGLIAHTTGLRVPHTAADEIRDAVLAFRDSGKPTLAWTETFGEVTGGMTPYSVASAFDQVWLQPTGELALTGVVAGSPFVRGALDRLGVVPQFSTRKEYKTAADLFRRENMSEPAREMYEAIVGSLTLTFVTRVARGRDLPPQVVWDAIDEGPMPARRALEQGFVDHLGYRDEAFAAMRAAVGATPDRAAARATARPEQDGHAAPTTPASPTTSGAGASAEAPGSDDLDLRFVDRYRKSVLENPATTLRRRKKPVVAVVSAGGPIHLGRAHGPSRGRSICPEHLGAALRSVGEEEHVRAVVLRIDSPGGSYVASDALRREILRLRDSGRPVVASMAGVAASGGYYLSMPCDEIVAGAGTLTGSIGVLAGKQVVSAGLERIGVHVDTVSQGRYAEMFSAQREFTDDEWARLDAWLDEIYADFTTKAAHDRGMDLADLEPLARGRVWTGADAAERGLVDAVGGLSVALDRACAAAGLGRDAVEVRALPKSSPFEMLSAAENSDSVSVTAGIDPLAGVVGRAVADTGEALFARAAAQLGLELPGPLAMSPLRLR